MKNSLAVMALVAIGLAGCNNNNSSNNAPSNGPTPKANNESATGSTNQPSTEAHNAPESAANNAPVAANNAPADPSKVLHPKDLIDKTPKIPDVDAMGANGWSKTQLEAKRVVQEADAKFKSMRNFRVRLHEDFAEGGFKGYFANHLLIGDQQHFLLNYASTIPNKPETMESYIVRRGDDGKYATLVNGGYKPGRFQPDSDLLKGWALNSTHYIADSVGTDRNAFTNLVDAAQKAKWKITVEKKSFAKADYQRIIMESPSSPKKRYEIMVDPVKKLPVQFNAVVFDKKKISCALTLGWDQSDTPLTAKDLTPKLDAPKVKTITPEEAKKAGIKIPTKT